MSTEKATLGGGCFWCLEAVFRKVKGVVSVTSGYAGGKRANPSYEQVCTGATGHAEVVEVVFDPAVVTYRQLLDVFFAIHDPTTLNRQGNDAGTQYRSVIYYHDEAQKSGAHGAIAEAGREFVDPVVTQLEPAPVFYPAEQYHQEYFERNPGQGYCQFVVAPKVAKFRKKFAGMLATDERR